MSFEQHWEESFREIQEANSKKFGEFGGVMSSAYSQFKPVFELFYKQGVEDSLKGLIKEFYDDSDMALKYPDTYDEFGACTAYKDCAERLEVKLGESK